MYVKLVERLDALVTGTGRRGHQTGGLPGQVFTPIDAEARLKYRLSSTSQTQNYLRTLCGELGTCLTHPATICVALPLRITQHFVPHSS